jgi:AraC family transcriptional regulator
MPPDADILRLLGEIRGWDGDVSLRALSERAGWSPFHLHRAFRRVVGATPKQYMLRIRLEWACARLVTSRDAIRTIALAAGFGSHEVFTRAFRRRFGCAPARYRTFALDGQPMTARARHGALTCATSPCVGLYHTVPDHPFRRNSMPTLSIARQEIAAQPVLFVRLRPARHELSAAIGEGLGQAFPYAMQRGAAIGGRPFTRYLSTGPGLFSIQVGMPLAAAVAGEGEVEAGSLPGGPVAVAMHAGSYEQLGESYAALERWMEANGLQPGGAPWESYVTDPADFPNPDDWRTEIYWPLSV